jgi:hypothetical protein
VVGQTLIPELSHISLNTDLNSPPLSPVIIIGRWYLHNQLLWTESITLPESLFLIAESSNHPDGGSIAVEASSLKTPLGVLTDQSPKKSTQTISQGLDAAT